jgi:hypothetical protein
MTAALTMTPAPSGEHSNTQTFKHSNIGAFNDSGSEECFPQWNIDYIHIHIQTYIHAREGGQGRCE